MGAGVRGVGVHDGEWSPRSCSVVEVLQAALETKTSGEGKELLQSQMKYVANRAVSRNRELLQTVACSAAFGSRVQNVRFVVRTAETVAVL